MTVTPLRAPVASVQGTLALDLSPRQAPPPFPASTADGGSDDPRADVVDIDPRRRDRLEQWAHRFAQAAVEVVGGDRPVSQLVTWTTPSVHADLQRRALLVARAGGHQPGVRRVQPVRPHVASIHTCFVSPGVAEASARVVYGGRSRALAFRFELRHDHLGRVRWVCTAVEFA